MRTNIRFASVLSLALLAPTLAACGGTPNTADSTSSTTAATAATSGDTTAAATAAPAQSQATAAAGDSTGSTGGDNILRIHQLTYPDIFDPQKSSVSNEIALLQLNYEGLTKLDSKLNAVPAAAESWTFNDAGDEMTFKLRANLKYSDGSPLTSKNFAYAIERTCDPNTAGEYQAILFEIVGCQEFATAVVTDTAALDAGRQKLLTEGVQTPDDQTLVLKLTNPAPYYPYVAGLWVMYPAKKELIEQGGETWWQQAQYQLGNGPYQITRIEQDQLVEFKANANYWEGKPKVDGMEFIYQKETAVALEAYRTGQFDIMQPDPQQLAAIKSDPELSKQLLTYASGSTFGMGFNLTQAPFDDPKVRQAFSMAFDRKTYCEVVRNGDCVPALSWIPPGIPGAIETTKWDFNPDAAKQAIAESKYASNMPEIKLTYSSDDSANQARAEWVAGQFRDILGITLVLEPLEGKVINAARKDPKTYPQWLLSSNNWYQDYPDPQNWLSVFWRCDAFAARISYCSQKLDELTKQADVELNAEKRIKLYQEAGQILVDELPSPFLFNQANIFLVKPNITGYTTTASDSEWPGERGSIMTISKS